jgi:hypothetical protein
MSLTFRKMIFEAFAIVVATFCCCSSDSNSVYPARRVGDGHGGVTEQNGDDIRSIILSLPEFRYHEESRDDFEKRLRRSGALPQNRRTSGNYLYVSGDGTFPPKEFTWDQNTSSLTVKVLGNDVDPPQLDKWRRVKDKWMEQ